MLTFLRKEQGCESPTRVSPVISQSSLENASFNGLEKPLINSTPKRLASLKDLSPMVAGVCPSPSITMRKTPRFGAKSRDVSWRSPKKSGKGLVTKRQPLSRVAGLKGMTKESYMELIKMHSKTLTQTQSTEKLSGYVDLTEDDLPSLKQVLKSTPAQKVATRLKIIEEKENRFPEKSFKDAEPVLDTVDLFRKIQEREIEEEVQELESELRNIRLQQDLKRKQKENAPIDQICAKYLISRTTPPKIPELSDEQLELVQQLWSRGRDSVIAEIAGEECKRSDLMTLKGLTWLNDLVINCYFNLIMQRADESQKSLPKVFCFKTFFYVKVKQQGHAGVKRWTRKVDIFSMDRLLFPIHLGVHWTLAAALMKEKKVIYLDSMGDGNFQCRNIIIEYLKKEHEIKKKAPLPDGWTTESLSHEIPQQDNSSDCGVFCCKFGDYLARGHDEFNFEAGDMHMMRKAICVEIASKRLIF